MQQLSQSLTENLSALDARFGQSADYYAKKIVLYGCPGCIVMFDGMASLDSLWELLLDAAGRQSASVRLTGTQAYAHILHGSAFPAESTPVQDMSQLVARLTAGMAVLLLEGCSSGIVFSVQGLKFRSVEEPSAEGNLRGSREGFTDLLRVNLSLLRRLVRTDTLMQEPHRRTLAAIPSTLFATARTVPTPLWYNGCAPFAKCKAGTAAGFQLFRAVAAARQGAAVYPGALHRAPGGRCRQALRGQAGNFSQRQPLGAGAARALQRAVRVSG